MKSFQLTENELTHLLELIDIGRETILDCDVTEEDVDDEFYDKAVIWNNVLKKLGAKNYFPEQEDSEDWCI